MRAKKLLAALAGFAAAIAFLCAPAHGKEKNETVVAPGKIVKVNYTLKVDGEIVDSSSEGNPMEFEVGSQQVLPAFEDALMGMKVGEKKSFKVSPEDGYGPDYPDNYQVVSKANMPADPELEVGMVLYATDSDGTRIPATVSEIREDAVLMNFNHPLAGKTLNFDVEIVSIN